MKLRQWLLAFFLCVNLLLFSQEDRVPKFGNGILNVVDKDSTWSMKFGARVQFLTSVNWAETRDDGWNDPRTNFLIRRARLKFAGFAFSPKLRYKIELGLSNRDMATRNEYTGNSPGIILDAVVMWNFYRNLELWAGQTKLPGNLERLISSGSLQLVDRSLLNARFNIDRDVGFQLHHHFYFTDNFLVREKLAFSQGEGRNVTTGNLGGYEYTARLELLPLGNFVNKGDFSGGDLSREKTPKLMVSGAYDFNQNAVKTRGNMGTYMVNDVGLYQTNISTLFLDALFKYKGMSFMGEYAHRDARDPIAKNSDGSPTGEVVQVGEGFNFQAGYLFPKNLEIAGRYTRTELRMGQTALLPETQYTIGISKYIVGHNLKIQSDLNYLTTPNSISELLYRLQLEIHF
ncbi:OprO/OprP family phosphate-selective porin [Flavobacteriaceae bacterium F89]|uniref:OprO/OprP family phosphate-selective porin n=1 Tax=Cerina litoralis TaxID=2874477 RepID=A0AAE3ETC3_9FLAO|nr:porin [Cerina litoralis]MCG2459201.1 OprO/OprP family phosphate-selective porin [Cerina litoralis]